MFHCQIGVSESKHDWHGVRSQSIIKSLDNPFARISLRFMMKFHERNFTVGWVTMGE
jgi:hypothetical protein